ncbi:hypothetical protein [Sphingobium yanoikuyae]|jgi:hypothetical protein|nr:hypothetical protein [Sphingobium yanoikuyae]MDV3477819.1 hypothetical protein [Sphingobium yanoikuyae]
MIIKAKREGGIVIDWRSAKPTFVGRSGLGFHFTVADFPQPF